MDKSREKELLARCLTDPEAFGEIYDENFDAIFRYVQHRVADVALAEDLTAQAFHKAMRKLGRFRWQGVSITAWLYRIAGNEVNSYLRKLYRRKKYEGPWVEHYEPVDVNSPDRELSDAESEVEKHALFLGLNKQIKKLDPQDQTILTLRYFEQKSYGEIADILGKREGTMRMRASRALDKLKRLLAKEDINHEQYREAAATCESPRGPGAVLQTEITG